MRRNYIWAISILILIACGLAGGLVVHAGFTGSSVPGPAQSAQFTPDPDAGGAPVISYQGVLQEGVNPWGEASADMTFTIYQGGTPGGGGMQVWEESQPGITISPSGYFSTLIGTGSPISQALFSQTADPMYLEVVVGTQTMSPRQRLAGVPYAFHAYYSGTSIYAAFAGTANYATEADNATNATTATNAINATTATTADYATTAGNADTLDDMDSTDFLDKLTYCTGEEGVVNRAAMADATASWAPQMTAGGAITAGDVVGIDEDGKLVTGCGSFGLPEVFDLNSAPVSLIDIAAFPSTSKVAIAYYENVGTPQGKAVICEFTGDTWTCGTPEIFNEGITSFIDIECYTIASGDYIAISYISSYQGRVWSSQVTGTTITPRVKSKQYWSASDATMDKIPGTDYFVIAFNTSSGPQAIIGQVWATDSGTVTFGTRFSSPSSTYMNKATVAALSSTRFVVTGIDTTESNGISYVGAMNNKTISYFQVSDEYHSGNLAMADVGAFGTLQTLVALIDKDNYNATYNLYGTSVAGQLSGYDVSFDDSRFFNMGGIDWLAMDISPDGSLAAIAYMDISDKNKGKVTLLDLSDSSNIIPAKDQMFFHSPPKDIDIVWLDNESYAIAYADQFDDSRGNIVMGKSYWVEPVGIAKNGGGSGNPINVAVGGVVDGSGYSWPALTPGAIYYGTIGGKLTTLNTGCKIGRAISTSQVVLNIDVDY